MSAPIALQLYTLREAMAEDFEGVVRKVADVGYVGVEPAGFPGTTPEAAARLFGELELEVPSAHTPLPIGEQKQEVLDTMEALGSRRIVSGLGPDDFKTMDRIKAACDRFNEASSVAVEHGMTFGIHNHWWEFLQVEGRYVYQVMLEHLTPEVFFEVDTYWVKTAGADPAAVVRELGARAPLLHIKDGPCTKEASMTAVGEGVMDFHSIAEAGGKATEWMIVELDRCATDMKEAVVTSYTYLIEEGLARGNKS
ncbi:MAG: sugar phosphate isomerase/epimerase [Candidatus Latescibacteria bacterium]|nr:sugar phosphate isomerase/epimerase [Candidatus Latescibacterota bacterium]